MKNFIKRITLLLTPSARSAGVYYLGNFFLSFSRYLFHLILLRLLVPSQYGEFLSYLSLINLFNVPITTISTVVTKFVSDFRGREDSFAINHFFYYLFRKLSPLVFVFSCFLILFASPLAHIFKANSTAITVLGVSLLLSLFQTILNSYVIAFQKFIYQTVVGLLGVAFTIVVSVVFIKLGFGATGALIGQLSSAVFTSILLIFPIRHAIFPKQVRKRQIKFDLSVFTGFSFIFALSAASLISTDILIVRVFYDPHISGIYSSLSMLGRMIYYGLTPFCSLILPIAAHRHAQNNSTKNVFLKLGFVVFIFALLSAGLFSVLPSFVIKVLSGPAYLEAAPFLPYFAFSMAFFALSQFIVTYLMAVGKPKANLLFLLAAVLQPILIICTHTSFALTVFVNFLLQSSLLISLLFYSFLYKNPQKSL